MILYGSHTSPFVRRIRLLMDEIKHDFVVLNIFLDKDRSFLSKLNPTHKIPMLQISQDKVIYDSYAIYRHLIRNELKASRYAEPWSLERENTFTVIDSANDSMVELLLCSRSGMNVQENILFFNLQRERISSSLTVLNEKVLKNEFDSWDFVSICLFCLVDWGELRGFVDLSEFAGLRQFRDRNSSRSSVQNTDPRVG